MVFNSSKTTALAHRNDISTDTDLCFTNAPQPEDKYLKGLRQKLKGGVLNIHHPWQNRNKAQKQAMSTYFGR
jgi:hypothetical protein